MTMPLWAWAGTLAILAVLIAADLLVTRGTGSTGLRGAAVLSGLWIAAGLAFGGALWLDESCGKARRGSVRQPAWRCRDRRA